MIYAVLKHPDGSIAAELTDTGWTSPMAGIAGVLDTFCRLGSYSPSQGNPVACAARDAAKLLDGASIEITPLREPDGDILY